MRWADVALLAGLGLAALAPLLVLALRFTFVVAAVSGTSMTPAFHDGDRVLVRRGGRHRARVGTVVVLRSPFDESAWRGLLPAAARSRHRRWMIKRIAALAGDRVPDTVAPTVAGAAVVPAGTMVVLSDNPAGTDSRRWGFVPVSEMLGVVVRKLPGG